MAQGFKLVIAKVNENSFNAHPTHLTHADTFPFPTSF